jgi:hypothetical protein
MSVQTANLLDLPLEVRAEMAMKEAVAEVIEDHIRSGRPIHIWRDGRVVEVSADELRAQRTPS